MDKLDKTYDKLTAELQSAINEAEKIENERTYFYFQSSLCNARGTLSGLINPPRPHTRFEISERDIKRVIWHLKNSMINQV